MKISRIIKNIYFYKTIALGFVVLIIGIVVIGMFRGILYNDGGYMLEAGRRVAIGQLPYRDFHFIYTPGSVLFLGLIFRLFSISVLSERIAMLILSIFGSIFLFLIMRDFKKEVVIPLLCSLIYGVWGPLHINFSIPTMFVLIVSFIFLFYIQRSVKTGNNFSYFTSGLLAFLVLFFKQNFGVAILFVSLITFVLNKIKVKKILLFVFGYMTLLLIWVAYMYLTDSLVPFKTDFILFTWEKIFVEKRIATGFPLDNPIKLFIYLTPLIISLWSFITLVNKKKFAYIAIPLTGIFYYIFGIRPSTDYVHLTPLLALSGPSLFILFAENRKIIKILLFIAVILLLTFGIYSGFFRNYYRWNSPLINQNQLYKNKKVLINTHPEIIHNLNKIIETINLNTETNDQIFVYGDAPLIQYISNRETPINHISTTLFSKKDYNDMLSQIINSKIKTILVTESGDMSTVVGLHIQENYLPNVTVSGITLWSKR